jgi:serine/threonine-protein kinase
MLCARLDATVQVLGLIAALVLARGLWLPERDPAVLIAHAWVLVALGVVHIWLLNDRELTVRQLRALELFVFGLVAALLATSQYRLMMRYYRQDDATLVLAAMKSSVFATMVLLTTYGIFIPNGWRRAALVVTPLALVPAAVAWLLLALHPELAVVAARVASLEQSTDNGLLLLIGAVLAIFGTQIVGALCARVSEAHHLGPYHLRERIGCGGMGEVYLAEHQFLKRPCAIKLIRPGRAADPRALARFEREVRTTAQLSHWNTVEVYDYGRTEDGTFFYVMEYLPGLSLDELVRRHGPLPPERVIYLLRQACSGLREAHGLGMIHRDIKPANIFASHRGGLHDVTKLLDFGLAKRNADAPASQLSHHGSITGSPLYMSPEQASGQRADHRSDIYSLGAVAFYLLTGKPPFQGENALAVMIAHARDAAPAPSTLRDDIPADLEAVVLRCLAKNPAERYPDAASLEQALVACAAAVLWTEDRAAVWWRAQAAVQTVASKQTVGYAC